MKKIKGIKNKVIIIALLVALAVTGLVKCGKSGSNGKKEVRNENYTVNGVEVPKEFSRSEKRQLKDQYEKSYEDEKNALKEAVAVSVENFDEYGDIKEGFQDILNNTENFYQAVNELDPDLKDVIADDVAFKYGDSPLEYYAIDKGVGMVLDDNDTGKELRNVLATTAVGLAESFAIWSCEENKTTRKDALEPIAQNKNYVLTCSLGNMQEIVDEIAVDSGYRIAMRVFDEREENLIFSDFYTDFYTDDTDMSDEERLNLWLEGENIQARRDALENSRSEWKAALYDWKKEFLKQMGLKDADSLLKAEDEDNTDEAASNEITEDGINKNTIGYMHVYEIIKSDGTITGAFLAPYSSATVKAYINNDGYVSFTALGTEMLDFGKHIEDDTHVIMDNTGKVLYQNDPLKKKNRVFYYDVSPYNTIIKMTEKSDFENGDYISAELIMADGSTKKLVKGENLTFDGDNYGSGGGSYYLSYSDDRYASYSCDSNGSGYVDMKTGEIISGEAAKERDERELNEEYLNNGGDPDFTSLSEDEIAELKADKTRTMQRLNENYLYDDNAIYDNSGKKVKKLEDGKGVKAIHYANKHYWIVSNTNWYYVLDDKFKQVLEPVKFKETEDFMLTDYGLLIRTSDDGDSDTNESKTELYDEKGNVILKLPKTVDFPENADDFIIGDEKTGWANMNTKEVMLISEPESKYKELIFDIGEDE